MYIYAIRMWSSFKHDDKHSLPTSAVIKKTIIWEREIEIIKNLFTDTCAYQIDKIEEQLWFYSKRKFKLTNDDSSKIRLVISRFSLLNRSIVWSKTLTLIWSRICLVTKIFFPEKGIWLWEQVNHWKICMSVRIR